MRSIPLKSIVLASGAQTAAPSAAPTPSKPEDRSGTFRSVSSTEPQVQSGEMLLIEAYAFMWLAAFFFVWRSIKHQRSLDARIEQLQRDLDAAQGSGSGGGSGASEEGD